VSAAYVAGLDAGGSSVKAWARSADGKVTTAVRPTRVLRPAPHRVEAEPGQWWEACASALREVAAASAGATCLGVTVCSLRQGFLLLDGAGHELGTAVLNADRRGAPELAAVRGHYATTGHWPAPELTLPKLLALRAAEPDRWAAARRLLFVHDWLLWRLTGEQVTGVDYACAGGMADVAARGWAGDLLAGLGVPAGLLAPVVEAGTLVGGLAAADVGLPAGTPVIAGAGDTQLAAAGVGGLEDGVVTVVAGSSTPVQAAVQAPPIDPLEHPWVSTHASRDRWAVETNAGYPGTMAGWLAGVLRADPAGLWEMARDSEPGARGVTALVAAPEWSEAAWSVKAPGALVGLTARTSRADLARAVLEAHCYAVRANVEDLERVLGAPARRIVATGGGADRNLVPLLAAVLGRPVDPVAEGTSTAGADLVSRAVGAGPVAPLPATFGVAAGDRTPYEEPYERFRQAYRVLHAELPEGDA